MKYISLESIRPLGDLGARTALLCGRMTAADYRPERIFSADVSGWPGDWEGRAILAQTMLTRLTGQESPYLKANVAALEGNLNEKGYLKGILPDGEFDEQQLSGHGWLLRGLCEYYAWCGDEKVLELARRMAENLFLPLRGRMQDYPTDPSERTGGGAAAGNVSCVIRGWHLSTDTGCVFIPMDGLSRLWEITGDTRLGELLEEMFQRFRSIDLAGIKAQTHATLTALRAILRMYRVSGQETYLDAAREIFDLYLKKGMTATYANRNWFGRPEWTEPCAIIDSFIVAQRLFEYTGDTDYALTARAIWINGVCRAQRPNGGFGCDSCAGEGGSGDLLLVHIYEAPWCCSMRGGEGMAMGARFCFAQEGDTLLAPMFGSCRAEFQAGGGEIVLREDAEAARQGKVRFFVEENTAQRPVRLKALVSDGRDGGQWRVFRLPQTGGVIQVEFGVPRFFRGRRLMQGEWMLGMKDAGKVIDPERALRAGAAEAAPISDGYLMEKEALEQSRLRVLF